MRTISFDGVIVGGGGAGMRASLQLAQSGYKTAVISKVFPDDAHMPMISSGPIHKVVVKVAVGQACVPHCSWPNPG